MAQPQARPGAHEGGPSGPRANFGQRLVAVLIDGVLLYVVQLIVSAIIGRAGAFVALAIAIAYYIYLEGSPAGQTVGKKVLNIRVIDFATGGPLGFGKAAIRYVGRYVSGLPLFLGYFWMLWDRENQTWHDKIATTVVVPASAYPVESWPG